MSEILLTDICNEGFFEHMGIAVGGTAGAFIGDNKKNLMMYVKVNFSGLIATDAFPTSPIADIGLYVGKIYARSLQRIFDVLNADYDPLANKDLTFTEEKDGTDSVNATANSNSHVTNNVTSHYATTFENTSLEQASPTGKSTFVNDSTAGGGSNATTTYDTILTHREKGNIGVMKAQELVSSEVALRMTHTFFNAVITCVVIELSGGVWRDS